MLRHCTLGYWKIYFLLYLNTSEIIYKGTINQGKQSHLAVIDGVKTISVKTFPP